MEDKDSVGTLASEQKDFTFENECLNLFASINEIILSGEIYKSTVSIISKDTINKLEQFSVDLNKKLDESTQKLQKLYKELEESKQNQVTLAQKINTITADILKLNGETKKIKINIYLIYNILKVVNNFKYIYIFIEINSEPNPQKQITDITLNREIELLYKELLLHKVNNNSEQTILGLRWVTLLNFKIFLIDEGYSCDDVQIKEIEVIFEDIKQYISEKDKGTIINFIKNLLDFLSLKVQYLLYKIYFRLGKNDEVIHDTLIGDMSIDTIKNALENGIFKDFVKKIEDHYNYKTKQDCVMYSIANYDNLLANKFLGNNFHKNITSEDLHNICKYIKKNITYITQHKKVPRLIEYIKEIQNYNYNKYTFSRINHTNIVLIDRFNSFSYLHQYYISTNIIFLLEFSQFIEKYDNNNNINEFVGYIENIFEKFEIIKNKPQNNKTPNLHAYRYLFEIFIQFFNKIAESKSVDKYLPHINVLNNSIDKLYKYYIEYQSLIVTAEKHKNYPYYLHFDECLISSDLILYKNKIKIFLDSSYILPTNYTYLKQESVSFYYNLTSNFNKILQNITMYKLINIEEVRKQELEEFEKKNIIFKNDIDKRFDDKVKEGQTTAIQITGYFIGIVSIIFSTSKIVPEFSDTESAVFSFYLALSASLILFSITLSIIIRPRKNRVENLTFDYVCKNKKLLCNKLPGLIYNNARIIILISISIVMLIFFYCRNSSNGLKKETHQEEVKQK